MISKRVTDDLAESSFAGVTTQEQLLITPYYNKRTYKGDKRYEELRLTAIMVSMEDALATRESNNKALSLQYQRKHEKEELAK
eukprot:4725315-Ditylum_brightwellii.AAC.1